MINFIGRLIAKLVENFLIALIILFADNLPLVVILNQLYIVMKILNNKMGTQFSKWGIATYSHLSSQLDWRLYSQLHRQLEIPLNRQLYSQFDLTFRSQLNSDLNENT